MKNKNQKKNMNQWFIDFKNHLVESMPWTRMIRIAGLMFVSIAIYFLLKRK
ncbi:MAG: hypothetical protein AABX85_03455 [Nanoarchaeota archaeon]